MDRFVIRDIYIYIYFLNYNLKAKLDVTSPPILALELGLQPKTRNIEQSVTIIERNRIHIISGKFILSFD
jgi:hypothetical protein